MVFIHIGAQFGFHGVHVKMRVWCEDVNGFEVVLLTKHVVISIVCRGYLEATCTETDFYIAVLDDWNGASYAWHDDMLAA